MNRTIRRGLVIIAVAIALVGGLFSIRIAADLAAAAAPPPAPPISLATLQSQLTAEQARGDYLQGQLDDLIGVTGELNAALDSTQELVDIDGLTAKELRDRLKAAEARLAKITKLLKKASDRLAKLGVAGPTVPPASKPKPTTKPGVAGTPKPTAKPQPTSTPKPTAKPSGFSLSLKLGGGGVVASWTECSVNGFYRYALVRSTDSEIHYPPEDRDTVVAEISSSSTTGVTDTGAPSGKVWYRVWCLVRPGGETKTAATTNTVSITVP